MRVRGVALVSDDLNYLIGEFDAQVWTKAWLETIAEHPEIPTDEGTMIGWFANALMSGYDHGVRHEQQRDFTEKLREVIFQAAGAATRPLLEDHPDYVFPSERVSEAVEYVCEQFGIPPLPVERTEPPTPEQVAAEEAAKLGTVGQSW